MQLWRAQKHVFYTYTKPVDFIAFIKELKGKVMGFIARFAHSYDIKTDQKIVSKTLNYIYLINVIHSPFWVSLLPKSSSFCVS